MIRELTCIGCPMGCRLVATLGKNGEFISAEGYSCNIGKKYAEEECIRPTRMVTSLVKVEGAKTPLSVKTSKPIDKTKIFDCLKEIESCRVAAPVRIGDIIIKGVCGSEVDIVATRELKSL